MKTAQSFAEQVQEVGTADLRPNRYTSFLRALFLQPLLYPACHSEFPQSGYSTRRIETGLRWNRAKQEPEYTCGLNGDIYDDCIEDSRPPAAGGDFYS